MPGRHRTASTLRRPTIRTPAVIALVALVATGLVLVVQNLADAEGCSGNTGVRLTVAADPAIAPAVREAADAWIAQDAPELNGGCVAVDVTAAGTADVATALAASAGGFLDAAEPAEAGELPDVWVPDSSYWVSQLRSVSRGLFAGEPAPLATSPVMLAASPAAADLFDGGPVDPEQLREPVLGALDAGSPPPMRLTEPRRDTAGVVGAGWLQQALVTTDEELPNLVGAFRALDQPPADAPGMLVEFDAVATATGGPDDDETGSGLDGVVLAAVSEQAIETHNQTAGASRVAALPVTDAPVLDFPFAGLARAVPGAQTAAGMLHDALTDRAAVFGDHGFRPVSDEPVVGPPEQVAGTVRIWTSATRDARVLSVINVNASMAEPIGPVEVPLRRIDAFQAAAEQGLGLFTPESELGHWEYTDDWREGAPIATLTEEHQAEILASIGSVTLAESNDSAFFEVLLDGYRELKEGYDPARSNTLIVWTDTGDNVADDSGLTETLEELERLADVTRPIRVILLGLGPDVDMTQLTAVADATGGGAFQLENPDEIGLVFLRALLT
ncbi:substrate-binding domain-containing protein [Natronosporangium hydrolyticum]|uniref:Substrate-binding domain-containing protein n=1 Tax=Natronosporangium hydrolyticum TaxID=2811111 RepID=A0A895YES7_9ACTN|nr:substrate-binding domain-containing protein [Natronosporangium hydrolyticum]QSB14645.1 substrate-binding domain-containing protein [Natronosporangium hydrolyticum]